MANTSLPKYICLEGDNGDYLRAVVQDRLNYLQFSGKDWADRKAIYEVFDNGNGTVRIKSLHYNMFWRNTGGWIRAERDEKSSIINQDCWFQPFKIDDNTIALKSVLRASPRFCKRYTADKKPNTLCAYVDSVTTDAKMKVKEPLISRNIYNVDYKLDAARIYNQKVIVFDTHTVQNSGTEDNTLSVTFKYTETTTETWNSSVSLKLGVDVSMKARIPFILKGTVSLKSEFERKLEWGTTKSVTVEKGSQLAVVVKPNTKLTVSLIATTGTCDVPFSYTQDDILITGDRVTRRLHDGLYTGANTFDLKFETSNETRLV